MANDDDTIYVAVGEVEESELTLLWTLHTLSPLKVCILHVHQPSKMISSSKSTQILTCWAAEVKKLGFSFLLISIGFLEILLLYLV